MSVHTTEELPREGKIRRIVHTASSSFWIHIVPSSGEGEKSDGTEQADHHR
jgi:hypothetical protein